MASRPGFAEAWAEMATRTPVIAILDDEPDFRRALARLLAAHDYDAVGFGTGRALLEAVAQYRFDCITLDIDMSGMGGLEVLAALRVAQNGPPVIVITGHDSPDNQQRAAALSIFAYHRKPVRAATLMPLVARACGR